jgi:hypothetical protein
MSLLHSTRKNFAVGIAWFNLFHIQAYITIPFPTPPKRDNFSAVISCQQEFQQINLLYKIWSFHGCDYEECHSWNSISCSSCKNRRPGGTYRHSQRATVASYCNVFLVFWLFSPLRWRRYVPPKRLFLQETHGVKSQNTTFLNTFIGLDINSVY